VTVFAAAGTGNITVTSSNSSAFAPAAVWTANTAYVVGTLVRPPPLNATIYFYRCTTAGTSGASVPNFSSAGGPGGTVSDGIGVVWTTVSLCAYAVSFSTSQTLPIGTVLDINGTAYTLAAQVNGTVGGLTQPCFVPGLANGAQATYSNWWHS
jgi:hypothetical protein